MTEREKQIQRMFAGLGPDVDQPDPAPHSRTPITESEQHRQRELALLDVAGPAAPRRYSLEEQRQRRLAGISEGVLGPPAVALRGASINVGAGSNSSFTAADGSGYYSSGANAFTGTGTQQPSPHPLPSPDPEATAVLRLQQALDVARECLRLRKPMYRAAVQFCCDAVEFAVDLGVNGWVAPDDVFIGGANIFSTLKDALADNGELDLAQTAEVAAQLTSALAALKGAEQAERTRAPAKRPPMLLEQATPFTIFEVKEITHQGARLLKIRGTCIRADETNGNGRQYSSKILEREAAKLNAKIMSGESIFAHVDHPSDGIAKISDTAAMWQSIEWDPKRKEIVGAAIVIPTQRGRDLRAVVESGGRVGISARGFGTTSRVAEGYESVNPDYSLSTFDFVVGASCPGAYAEAQ